MGLDTPDLAPLVRRLEPRVPQGLVGRELELERLSGMLNRAQRRQGSAVVLRGEAGVGKSALAARLARLGPASVARVHGLAGGLPEPLAAVVSLVRQLSPGHPLARGIPSESPLGAVLTEVCEAIEAQGRVVVIVIDDPAGLDEGSRTLLRGLADRVDAMPAMLLVTARPGEASAFAGLPVVPVRPLGEQSTRQLLAARGLSRTAADSAWRVCGGNPLALTSLASLLTPGQRATGFGVDEVAHLLTDPLRLQAVRLEAIPTGIRALMRIAALDDTENIDIVTDAADSAANPVVGLLAEYGDIVTVDKVTGRVVFGHPLLRAAAAMGTDDERRATHARLCRAYGAAGDVVRAAWHEAMATDSSDEVARRLARTSESSPVAAGMAARLFERAARTAVSSRLRAQLLLAASEQLSRLGTMPHVTSLLEEALTYPMGHDERIHATVLLASQEFVTTSGDAGVHRLVRLAEQPATPASASVELLLLAAILSTLDFRADVGRTLAQRALDQTPTDDYLLRSVLAATIDITTWQETPQHPAEVLVGLVEEATCRSPLVQFALHAAAATRSGTFGGEGVAVDAFRQTVTVSRSPGAPAMEWYASLCLCLEALRCGDWQDVYLQALDEGGTWDSPVPPGWGWILGRVWLAAAIGHTTEARRDVTAALMHTERGFATLVRAVAMAARLAVEVADQQWEAAVTTGRWLRSWHDTTTCYDAWRWSANYLEALVRTGHHEDAHTEILAILTHAGAFPQWAWEVTTRCRALLATSPREAIATAAEAVAIGRQRHDPLELARTLLIQAEVLHRHGHSYAASLAEARRLLQCLGANGWLPHADRLTTADVSSTPTALSTLSRAEYRVALVVADGATNRETAQRLHLAEKTVDTHLTHICRKLAVRNRTQLAALLHRHTGDSRAQAQVAQSRE